MKIKLFTPYVNEKAIENVTRVLKSGYLAEGPEVKRFEEEFAKKFILENVVAVNSGTSALELAYELADIQPGDEVITPVLTCTATNLPLIHRKAKIVFADIDYSLNVDPNDIIKKITDKTKAIVFVDLGGGSENFRRVQQIAHERKITLIRDGAQALGNDIGQHADFTCISLQAIKTLTAGDGGILICKSAEHYEKARRLRWFGYDREEKHRLGDTDLTEAGYKYHMNDISAAIARGNLEDYDEFIKHRTALMKIYQQLASHYHVNPASWATKFVSPVHWHVYRELLEDICEVGQYHYRNDKYTVFKEFKNECPVMDEIEERYFFLPMHMEMSEESAKNVVRKMLCNVK